jgi:hypothetical protein
MKIKIHNLTYCGTEGIKYPAIVEAEKCDGCTFVKGSEIIRIGGNPGSFDPEFKYVMHHNTDIFEILEENTMNNITRSMLLDFDTSHFLLSGDINRDMGIKSITPLESSVQVGDRVYVGLLVNKNNTAFLISEDGKVYLTDPVCKPLTLTLREKKTYNVAVEITIDANLCVEVEAYTEEEARELVVDKYCYDGRECYDAIDSTVCEDWSADATVNDAEEA